MNPHLQPVGDPVIFENATICLEAAVAVLEREGHVEEARKLRGLEVVSPDSAEVALDALRSITASTPDSQDAIAFARTVLARTYRVAMSPVAAAAA
jgi:hypothetical protein